MWNKYFSNNLQSIVSKLDLNSNSSVDCVRNLVPINHNDVENEGKIMSYGRWCQVLPKRNYVFTCHAMCPEHGDNLIWIISISFALTSYSKCSHTVILNIAINNFIQIYKRVR